MSTFDLGRFAASITEVPRQNSEPKQLSGRARGFTFFPCVVHMLRQKTQENYKLLPQTLGTIGVIMFHRISFIYVRFTDRSSWQLGIWKWLIPSKIDSFENIEREAPKKREKIMKIMRSSWELQCDPSTQLPRSQVRLSTGALLRKSQRVLSAWAWDDA